MSRNVQAGLDQELQCLILIGRFGWLRLQEVSKFLWYHVNEKNAYQYTQNLIRKLIDKDLVFTHKLPQHAGTAVLLNEKGAKIVRDNGFANVKRAKLSKVHIDTSYLGDKYIIDCWIPPPTWKHDLYAHGLCAHMLNDGVLHSADTCPKFWTESELRKLGGESNRFLFSHLDHVRFPDLMIESDYGILGIEIEKSRKFGHKNRLNMILNLLQNNKIDGCARHSFGGVEPKKIAFAIFPDEFEYTKSGGRKKIDHEINIITSALSEMTRQNVDEVELFFIYLEVKNFGVTSYSVLISSIDNPVFSEA